MKKNFMKNRMALSLGLALLLGTAGCHGEFAPSPNESYAPHSEGYVHYVNGFTGTDTHVFEKGDRSFVLRGTPPFAAMISPWYDWRDVSADAGRISSIADCGNCGLPAGAEADILSRSLAGYSAHLELCYMSPDADTTCFKGQPLRIESDNGKDWQKLRVSVPLEDFRQQHFTKANMRIVVEGRPKIDNNTFSEGVVWVDDFHYQLAEMVDGEIQLKRSGALWPDDYAGWQEYHNAYATADGHLVPNGMNK